MSREPPVVAVTGASGYIGTGLLQELEGDEELKSIVAIDSRPPSMPFHNVISERLDVAGGSLDEAFRGHRVNTVVHLAFNLRPGRKPREVEKVREANLNAVRSVLKACSAARVSNVIFLSSHTVYGARPENPIPITEEAPTHPSVQFQYSYDKALCEEAVQSFAQENPSVSVTSLRSCVVMGPGADNYVTRAFFKPVLLGVMGYDPPLQFVHEDDLSKLLHLLIVTPHAGIFNVAGDGIVRYSQMARLAQRRLIFLPSPMAYFLVQLAWKMGIQKDAPSAGLDFVRYPMLLSTSKLKHETGFSFFYTSEEALTAFLME